jgi:hypothetical protein
VQVTIDPILRDPVRVLFSRFQLSCQLNTTPKPVSTSLSVLRFDPPLSRDFAFIVDCTFICIDQCYFPCSYIFVVVSNRMLLIAWYIGLVLFVSTGNSSL